MPRKRLQDDDPRRKRRAMTLQQKGQILDMLDRGMKVVDVASSFKVNESTIRTIHKNKEKVRQSQKVAAGDTSKVAKQASNEMLIKVDKLLALYVRRQEKAGIPVLREACCIKAREFLGEVSKRMGVPPPGRFKASRAWAQAFFKRHGFRHKMIKDDAITTEFPGRESEEDAQEQSLIDDVSCQPSMSVRVLDANTTELPDSGSEEDDDEQGLMNDFTCQSSMPARIFAQDSPCTSVPVLPPPSTPYPTVRGMDLSMLKNCPPEGAPAQCSISETAQDIGNPLRLMWSAPSHLLQGRLRSPAGSRAGDAHTQSLISQAWEGRESLDGAAFTEQRKAEGDSRDKFRMNEWNRVYVEKEDEPSSPAKDPLFIPPDAAADAMENQIARVLLDTEEVQARGKEEWQDKIKLEEESEMEIDIKEEDVFSDASSDPFDIQPQTAALSKDSQQERSRKSKITRVGDPPTSAGCPPPARSRHLHSREKEIIYNVNKYFLEEKANRGPIMPPSRAVARTAKATNVAERTVRRICSKFNHARCTQKSPEPPVFTSPPPKRRCATVTNLDSFEKRMFRRTVLGFYENNEVPTLHKISEELKESNSFSGSIESMRRVLTQMGFEYVKVDGRKILMERSSVVAARTRFLREMRQLRQSSQSVVYLDETVVSQHDTTSRRATGTKPPTRRGSHLVILHAGTKDGFVNNGELVFQVKNDGDSHSQVNAAVFEEWFRKQLLPNIAPNSVIVMDDAPHHSVLQENVLKLSWRKSEIKDWLAKKGVQPDDDLLKAELHELAKKYDNNKKYLIDTVAEDSGHRVVRLPPNHCHYNPIELIWAQVKSHVAKTNTSKISNLKPLVKEALSRVTLQDWSEAVQHTQQLQEEDARQDRTVDHFLDSFVINVTESSDEELSD